MTERQYYKRALLLPIVLPIVCAILLIPYFVFRPSAGPAQSLARQLFIIAASGGYAFLPYVFVAIALYWNLSRSDRVFWGHPLLTVMLVPPITGLVAAAISFVLHSPYALSLIVLACVFGYPYALLIVIGWLVGEAAGWITREHQPV